MKRIMLMVACLSATSIYAQKIFRSEVPASVTKEFFKYYPDVKNEKWEKENVDYEAEFELKKVEMSVLFSSNGEIIETETEININTLPKGVNEYMAKNYPGEKIKEASKIVDAKGKTTYEAEIKQGDMLFDEDGNFLELKKETNEDEED